MASIGESTELQKGEGLIMKNESFSIINTRSFYYLPFKKPFFSASLRADSIFFLLLMLGFS
jgi:hypothetical protein